MAPRSGKPKRDWSIQGYSQFSSFFSHQDESSLQKVLPLRRQTWWTPVLIAVAVLAVTGAVTILQTIVHWTAAHVL